MRDLDEFAVPLGSLMTPVPEELQKFLQEDWKRIQQEIRPVLDEMARLRRKAYVEAMHMPLC